MEISLRLQNIGNIKGVELAILEPNGQISTTLKPEKVPATKEDIQKILDRLDKKTHFFSKRISVLDTPKTPPLFKEVFEEAKDEDFKPEKP